MDVKEIKVDLVNCLRAWDGSSVDPLQEVYRHYGTHSRFLPLLTQELGKETTGRPSSWLLKHYFEANRDVPEEVALIVFSHLDNLKHWEEKLHILQCFQYLPLEVADKNQLVLFIENCLTEKNKFVRAWAYNGYFLLAQRYPDMQVAVTDLLDKALEEEAASVQARIRALLKN